MSIKVLLSLFFISMTAIGATSAKATVTASTIKVAHQFTESSEGKSNLISWNQSSRGGITEYIRNTKDEKERSRGTTTTLFWELKSPNKTLAVSVKDKMASIKIVTDGKEMVKTQSLSNFKFTYPPSFYLSNFVKSNKKKTTVWVVNKAENNLRKMIFTKKSKETITINGKEEIALKIEMKPPGVAGIVWKAYYWVNPSNGQFIKYVGKKGPPGTPDYTIIKTN